MIFATRATFLTVCAEREHFAHNCVRVVVYSLLISNPTIPTFLEMPADSADGIFGISLDPLRKRFHGFVRTVMLAACILRRCRKARNK